MGMRFSRLIQSPLKYLSPLPLMYATYQGEKKALEGQPGPAPISYDTGVWGRKQRQGESEIGGKYGAMRSQLQAGMTSRGLGRSGFLGSGLARIGGEQEQAQTGLMGDLAMQRQQYEQALTQQNLAEYQQRLMEEQTKWDRRMALLSGMMGATGALAGRA